MRESRSLRSNMKHRKQHFLNIYLCFLKTYIDINIDVLNLSFVIQNLKTSDFCFVEKHK
jgi:hypothetical protein